MRRRRAQATIWCSEIVYHRPGCGGGLNILVGMWKRAQLRPSCCGQKLSLNLAVAMFFCLGPSRPRTPARIAPSSDPTQTQKQKEILGVPPLRPRLRLGLVHAATKGRRAHLRRPWTWWRWGRCRGGGLTCSSPASSGLLLGLLESEVLLCDQEQGVRRHTLVRHVQQGHILSLCR